MNQEDGRIETEGVGLPAWQKHSRILSRIRVSEAMRARLGACSSCLLALGFATSPMGAQSADAVKGAAFRVVGPRPHEARPMRAIVRKTKVPAFHDPFQPDADAIAVVATQGSSTVRIPATTRPIDDGSLAPRPGAFLGAVAISILVGNPSVALIDDGRGLHRVLVNDEIEPGVFVDDISGAGVALSDGEFIKPGMRAQTNPMSQVPAIFPTLQSGALQGDFQQGTVPDRLVGGVPVASPAQTYLVTPQPAAAASPAPQQPPHPYVLPPQSSQGPCARVSDPTLANLANLPKCPPGVGGQPQ